MPAELYADAVRVLDEWTPPSAQAGADRRRFLELLAASPDSVRADHPGAHLTATAVIVHPDRRRVLLCLHGRLDIWVPVGGHCEPEDSTLADAAHREATEESGIAGLAVHRTPIDLDIHHVNCRTGASFHYDVRFAALAPADAVARVSAESHALGWFTPEDLPEPRAEDVDRLVQPALAAYR